MKSIQNSTTNMIYYVTKHPEIRQKLLKEIRPPLENLQNMAEDLDYDTVMGFEFL